MLGLKKSADLRTLVQVATYFSLVAFQYSKGPFHPIVGIPLVMLTAHFAFLGAVAVHNTIHCPMFASKALNRMVQLVLTLTYGHPVSAYVPGHNLSHHKHTQTPKDVMRTTKMRYRWHFLNGLLFIFHIGIDMATTEHQYFQAQKKLGRPIYKQMCFEWYFLYAVHAALLLLDWRKWVMVVFIPHMWAKFCIMTLNMLQHDGTNVAHKYNGGRNFTDPLLNFMCYNNGYHQVHHMWPGMHWSILSDVHDKKVRPYMHPGLDEPSLIGYVWRTFIFPGVRVDFHGNPIGVPKYEADEDWTYSQTETYSTKGDDL